MHDAGLDRAADQAIYLPTLDAEGGRGRVLPVTAMTITVRTAVEPLSLVNTIRGVIGELDGDLPMADVRPMERVLDDSGALIALFLGSVGIYGVLSYVVSTRTTEIGVRAALGASPGVVRRMILWQGMRLAVIGVLVGLIAAVALGRVMLAQLYGVSPVDAVTLVAGSAIFLTVAAVASLLPAARAARTAPVEALRAG